MVEVRADGRAHAGLVLANPSGENHRVGAVQLQQERPDDYVVATGETHSVQEFLEAAFAHVDLDWRQYVQIDPRYFRPTEVDVLLGDASKARRVLGWQPKVSFGELVRLMVAADLQALIDMRQCQDVIRKLSQENK